MNGERGQDRAVTVPWDLPWAGCGKGKLAGGPTVVGISAGDRVGWNTRSGGPVGGLPTVTGCFGNVLAH